MLATKQELTRRILHVKSAAIAGIYNDVAAIVWLIHFCDMLCKAFFAEGLEYAYLWPEQTAASRTGASCRTHL